jgi:hypothetical protein
MLKWAGENKRGKKKVPRNFEALFFGIHAIH